MDFKDLFKNSSNEIFMQNEELLEEHGMVNMFGSPNRLFLKFLESKNLSITEDEITEELILEFEDSKDSIDLRLKRIEKSKQAIFNQRSVWISLERDGESVGTDLFLDHDGIEIDGERTQYVEMDEIEISQGGWSKDTFSITTKDGDIVFEINENYSIALEEILEENIAHKRHDEIDDLLELMAMYEDGEISEEEYGARKAIIYSDDVYCTNCGFKLDEDCEYCPQCGHRVD